jgi:hypothetical protein
MYFQLDWIALRLMVSMPVEEFIEGYISRKDAYYAVKIVKSSGSFSRSKFNI